MKKGFLYGIIAIISMIGFMSCEQKPKQTAFFPMATKQCFDSEESAHIWANGMANMITTTYGPLVENVQTSFSSPLNGVYCGYVTWSAPIFD